MVARIYFTANTLQNESSSTHHGYLKTWKRRFKQYTIGKSRNSIFRKTCDTAILDVKEYENATHQRIDDQYKVKSTLETDYVEKGEIYNQKILDLTKRNFLALNNFSIAQLWSFSR